MIKILSERVLKLRQKMGLTQEEFAQKIPGKMDYSYIGKIERGQQYPSLKMMEKIAKAFSLPLGYFFQDTDRSEPLSILSKKVEELSQDKESHSLLRLALIMQIVSILCEGKPIPGLAVSAEESTTLFALLLDSSQAKILLQLKEKKTA